MKANIFQVSKKELSVLVYGAFASFGLYFCMYAFRRPFTVATFEQMSFFGVDFKILLILAQVLGYMLSKFLGIRIFSGLRPKDRARYLIFMIMFAELALVLFGVLQSPYNFI